MRILRTAGLWFLIVFGVLWLVAVVETLLELRWPNDIVSMFFILLGAAVIAVPSLGLVGVGVYFLFWRRQRRGDRESDPEA